MQEWLKVDLDAYTEEKKELFRGQEVDLLVSPYDVPEAVRGHYDRTNNRFILEFRYIGNEPRASRVIDNHLTYKVGVSSGRLYALEINIDSLNAQSVEALLGIFIRQQVVGALERLLEEPISPLREDNYRLAKEAVSSKQQELFEAIR